MATTPPVRNPREDLRRLVGTGDGSTLDALAGVRAETTEIEDFRPLAESLEWRLADAYWAEAGVLPFARNEVPYLVNNSGRLSEGAAALVLAALDEQRASLPERLVILELGAGTGLFARYFLDAFAAQCRRDGSDFYDRLLYVVSDRFERTVERWHEVSLFIDHAAHVESRVLDARLVDDLRLSEGAPLVVFCNYVLDILPSSIARRNADRTERLCVRTHLGGGPAAVRAAGLASLEEVRTLAASCRFEDLLTLLPILPYLEIETAFRGWVPAPGMEQELAATLAEGERVILNTGALACLERLLERVHAAGFVLVNDYGPVRAEDVKDHAGVQRFGGSVALGLNFPMLERVFGERGVTILAPDGDEERRVRTRFFGRRAGLRTREAFQSRFRLEADRYLEAPQEEARGHVAGGRRDEAVAAYRALIERNPRDWQMLGEAAEYVGLHLRDHAAGLKLARAALELNSWSSSWLWNVLGDCLYYDGKLEEAHQAFVQAQKIDPDDPRTNLNLAYTLSARGAHADALFVLARGLAHDGRNAYRARLLEKQAQVLAALSERTSAEHERLIRRSDRFR